ncbi:MAG: carbamoyl phosphate synthase small subunit, partial [Myxococcales bacterium]|nr:carbamoyl phosphate synthase small subunit [Myxococcales bacterium]
MTSRETAHLVLADGTAFRGLSVGAPGITTGEAVFTTGMTGYQEILTDPSYCGQIVTMTAPQIGNTGVNLEDAETRTPFVAGFVMR